MAEATAPADVTKELEIAKKYLTAKNYAKAKVILEDLDHPTAKRWLQKIEEMECPLMN